jgi:hypothetical protein
MKLLQATFETYSSTFYVRRCFKCLLGYVVLGIARYAYSLADLREMHHVR